MKRRTSLEKALATLQEAEAHLQKLRAKAAVERAEILRDLHVSFGFGSRDELIQALVNFEGPSRHRGQRSATNAPTKARDPRARPSTKTTGRRLAARSEDRTGVSRARRVSSRRKAQATERRARPLQSSRRESEQAPLPEQPHVSRAGDLQTALPVQELPVEIQRLLDSVARTLQWSVPRERHDIVVEILTRGDTAAENWLWAQSSKEEVRALLRRFGGAGCDDETRDLLRRRMGLTEFAIPPRPFRPLDHSERSAHMH
jgi:hypothetical protein